VITASGTAAGGASPAGGAAPGAAALPAGAAHHDDDPSPAPSVPAPAIPAVLQHFETSRVEQPVPAASRHEADLPAAQPALGAALGRLYSRGAGTHELTVALHPAELGQVGVTATVRDGVLTVSLACADHAAHDAVRAALPTLHAELSRAGFAGVDVSLTGGGAQPDAHAAQQHAGRSAPDRSGEPRQDAGVEPDAAPRRRPVPDTALDRWL
jgi:flagellar hook-length control protein FliK